MHILSLSFNMGIILGFQFQSAALSKHVRHGHMETAATCYKTTEQYCFALHLFPRIDDYGFDEFVS